MRTLTLCLIAVVMLAGCGDKSTSPSGKNETAVNWDGPGVVVLGQAPKYQRTLRNFGNDPACNVRVNASWAGQNLSANCGTLQPGDTRTVYFTFRGPINSGAPTAKISAERC